MKYKAFISYSHAVDGKLAPLLHSALHRFAQPWHRLRSMRVFRDRTSLSATPELWPSIERALSQSEYFLLLASPAAAASEWVGREIDWWLTHKPADRLFVVLTHGELDWADQDQDFDWNRTDALPRALKGRFRNEPLWVDLRWAKDENDLSVRLPRFREAVLDLAAPLLDRDKDELDGDDVRQYRRTRRLVWTAVALLSAFAIAVGAAAVYASRQRDDARHTLAAADFNRASSLLEADAAADALAYLARAIRTEAANHDAANLLFSVLLTRNFPVLVGDALSHDGAIASVDFSPDGQRIVTAGGHSAIVWSTSTGKPIGDPLRHDFDLNGAKFSGDGKLILTFGDRAVIWHADAAQVVAVLQEDGDPVEAGDDAEDALAEFSPDSSRIAFKAGGSLRVHDTDTGATVGGPLTEDIGAFTFTPSGRAVLVAQESGELALWTPGAAVRKVLVQSVNHSTVRSPNGPSPSGLFERLTSVRFSPGGGRLVTAFGNVAQVWNAETGEPVGVPLQHTYVIQDAAFSPDGGRILTSSFDGTARLWDAATGAPLGASMNHLLANHGEFSRDGLRALTVPFEETTVQVWNALTGAAVAEPLGHEASVTGATFSADGRTVVTISDDGRARLWDVRPRSGLQLVLPHPAETTTADISSDGRLVVSGASDNIARLWDALTGQPLGIPMVHSRDASLRQPSGVAARGFINFALFSLDPSLVATSSTDETVRFWNAKTGGPIGQPFTAPSGATHLSFSADGRHLFVVADDHAWLLASATGRPVGQPMVIRDGSIEKATLSRDGRRAVTATDSIVFAWDTAAARVMYEFEHGHGSIEWVELSPNGNVLATAGDDGLVRFWDAASGRDMGTTLKHTRTVLSVRFSHDGSKVVTGSWDKTARIWDVATGAPIGAPMKHSNYVGSAEFSIDDTRIVTVSGGGEQNEGRVWSAVTGRPITESVTAGSAEAIRFGGDGNRLLLVPESGSVVALYDLPALTDHELATDVAFLADLAEAVGGSKLVSAGEGERLVLMSAAERAAVLHRSAPAHGGSQSATKTSLQRFLEWYLADPDVRTISPFATVTMPQWVRRQVESGTPHSVLDAMLRDWNNASLNARFAALLSQRALGSPQDAEARRARGEAEFFAMRARQLDATDPGIAKARAKVVK